MKFLLLLCSECSQVFFHNIWFVNVMTIIFEYVHFWLIISIFHQYDHSSDKIITTFITFTDLKSNSEVWKHATIIKVEVFINKMMNSLWNYKYRLWQLKRENQPSVLKVQVFTKFWGILRFKRGAERFDKTWKWKQNLKNNRVSSKSFTQKIWKVYTG